MVNSRARTCLIGGLVCTLAACTGGQEPPAPTSRPTQAAPSPPTTEQATPGAGGIGDAYYPQSGNGGYDATGYEVSIRYDPASGRLDGDTTVTARATQALSRFNLDLRGLTVESVQVGGRRAEFDRSGRHELVVTPPQPLPRGEPFTVRVRYHGVPGQSSEDLGGNGWQRTPSGGAFVLGEPHSASYWYPTNDHPRDKATFRLNAQVPRGWTAVSIGREEGSSTGGGWTTTRWVEPEPVAGYLTTVAIDRFTVERRTLADGTPVLDAYAPGSEDIRPGAQRVGEIIDFLATKFGDYPASTTGGIYLAAEVGYALETQGRPTYDGSADFTTIVHELAHQWYGNEVSVASWADICLNECLASYAEWLWAEGRNGDDLDARYRRAVDELRGDEDFWSERLYDMGAGNEFGGVYDKGPLALHALRRQIGDDAFNRVLREWPAAHAEGNASWPQFEQFVARIAGQDLRGFFQAWFHATERPADEYLHPGPL
ncbi:M1 family metallopeptidase [Prauserella oleivorans]|uniref:Aminopeptidase N n=1 Tax=Prauserella oleivorans TaxID=1478153 RepID=A0ABW5WB65_9PSEU